MNEIMITICGCSFVVLVGTYNILFSRFATKGTQQVSANLNEFSVFVAAAQMSEIFV